MTRTRSAARHLGGDERAVSTLVGYAIGLAIVTLLITGLLVATATVVADQRERTVRSELRVVGQQLSADLQAADTLVRADQGGSPEVKLQRDMPETVGGLSYAIAVDPGTCSPSPCLVLSTNNPDVTVEVQVATEEPVTSTTVTGGDVVIEYVSGALEVRNG